VMLTMLFASYRKEERGREGESRRGVIRGI
jgi:hypothetical protein